MSKQTVYSDLHVNGQLTAGQMTPSSGAITNSHISSAAAIGRTKLAQDTLAVFPVLLSSFRVHDAMQTLLSGTSSGDDLALVGTTFGTDTPSLQSSDLKAAGVTNLYARASVVMPECYDDGETVQLRLSAGMLTTISDGTATVDVEAYKSDREGGVDGADLCGTAAQSHNSLTLADLDFGITATGLEAGDILDVRVKMNITDAATATAVKGIIGAVELLCDIKG